MAAKRKAKSKATTKTKASKAKKIKQTALGPFDYTIDVTGSRVVIIGVNDGNIYGDKDQVVTFKAAAGAAGFTIEVQELKKNGNQGRASPKWPFKERQPSDWPRTDFSGTLKSPGFFERAFYKYTVSVAGAVPADPIIIIER
jgi:hypothetical protein